MKIAYFIDHLRGDGTQRALTQLVRGLGKRGHDQTVFCLNNSYDEVVLHELRSTPADVRVVGKTALACGYGLLSTRRWLAQEKFDAVVTMLFAADVIGRLLAWSSGVPLIVSSLRARNVNYYRVQRWLVQATMKLAHAVVVNSSHTREFAIGEEGVQTDRIFFIPNGVHAEDYTGTVDPGFLRKELGLGENVRLLGTLGRLTEQKGIDVLLGALSLLRSQDVSLVIVGIGEQETKLRILAGRLNLESRVHFVGYRRDVPKLLRAFDIYVHPARFEGMPNAVLEAMAAARPIVASSIDGIRELIEDGVHGWLVPPGDPVGLAKAIEEAFNDPKEACRRSLLARRRVIEKFSIDSMVVAWEAVLAHREMSLSQKQAIDRYG
jgi:glycosyltransferase involved in cell wall biosynthesis